MLPASPYDYDPEGLVALPDGTFLVSDEYGPFITRFDANDTAVSEITALSNTKFVLDERDGTFDPGAEKKLVQVDLRGATDIGPRSAVGTYDGADGGVRVGGKSVEAIAGKGDPSTTTANLVGAGITPVSQQLYLDLGALVSSVRADGTFYDHDKIEGVAILNGGHTVVISNDSDFGISGSTGDAPPFGLVAKTAPDGSIDRGEFLMINRN